MRASPVARGSKEIIVVDRDRLYPWETSYYLTQQRGTIGKFMSRDQLRAGQGSIPQGTKIMFLRHAEMPHPTDISLLLESLPLPGGDMLVRGYAISASKVKLSHSTIALRRGEARWPMDRAVLHGRHGYYYRAMEVRVDSLNPGEFALDAR